MGNNQNLVSPINSYKKIRSKPKKKKIGKVKVIILKIYRVKDLVKSKSQPIIGWIVRKTH